jgi:hypothetical protein
MRLSATLVSLAFVGHSIFAATTIAEGPAKVTFPDRFTIEKKTVSDEGGVGGFLTDSKTKMRIRYWINHWWAFKGLHPTKVEWQKVVHFERSPAGWYDWQYFVFEDDTTLRIEARYAIQRSMFQASIPKGQDYHACLEALKLIDVQLNQGWKLVRGKSFDEFEVIPTKSK